MVQRAEPNAKPGKCCKCDGTGIFQWARRVYGTPSKSGTCYDAERGALNARGAARTHQ
jgi:hypothetical protein